jgi:hypothetical protein
MVALRAFLYSLSVFAALAVISLIVAAIMRLMYAVLHKNVKKAEPENNTESGAAPQ